MVFFRWQFAPGRRWEKKITTGKKLRLTPILHTGKKLKTLERKT
jgi:hypothetical protein